MNAFWKTESLAAQYKQQIALIAIVDNVEQKISYADLDILVKQAKQHLRTNIPSCSHKSLLMLVARHSIKSIVYYLAALQLNQTLCWIDKDLTESKKETLLAHYKINLWIDEGEVTVLDKFKHNLHPDLAMLMTTSGSTGSPSIVRLSYANLHSNCTAICKALALQFDDKVITTLPFHYSFGLSILNTHLNQGSTIFLNEHGILTREFWQSVKQYDIRCLYGVPYIFDILLKLNLARLSLSSLRFLAVAGGKLSAKKVLKVNQWCIDNKKLFFVMYGQTEATARITVLSPNKVAAKPDSIGQAIAGGQLWLASHSENKNSQAVETGELCYSGENVMMGIASNIEMLALPNQHTILRTGDIACCDAEGDYRIIGRLKRFIKVIGQRINLDEVEGFLIEQGLNVACCGEDDLIRCYIEKSLLASSQNVDEGIVKRANLDHYESLLCDHLQIHHSYCKCFFIESIPTLSSGKINYPLLEKMLITSSVLENKS